MFEAIQQTAAYIRQQITTTPAVGVILGSGLGGLIDSVEISAEIPYESIPNFPVSTVEGHHGKLIFGTIAGEPIIAMAGRFHFYEGYSAADVVFPIRVMKQLGVETLLISNAAGGVQPGLVVGDLMIITDHISFAIVNPLLGQNDDRMGPRFPDMSEP